MRIEIVGNQADRAAQDLVEHERVGGSYQVLDDRERADPITVIAAITGIVGGGLAAADILVKWYDRWRGTKNTPDKSDITRALIVLDDGRRVAMENISVEKLSKFLEG